MNESVIRIRKEGNSEELAKIVANMKSQQFNEQSVGNASHSDHGSETAKTNGLPKEGKKKRETKKELPLRVEDKSQSVVDMGEDSEIESVEDEERPSTKEIVVNCVSWIFSLVRVMLSVALGVSVFVDPTRIPYGIAVCACIEPVSMLVQLFTMSKGFAYKQNSITSLSVLLFCFCIAFHQVTDTVCMLFCIVLGLEIVADMLVIYASGEIENSAVVFTTVSLLAFVGGFAVLIEGLLPLFGVLLVFQILVVVIVFNTPDQVAGTASLIAIPAGYFMLLYVAIVLVNSWWLFFYLLFYAIIVAYVVSRCCANSDACIILFGFDLALFLWWCWMTLSSQSIPYACHFLLSVIYGITTGFFAAFDTKVNKWTVTILVITSTCLMGCSWISVAIDHVALTVVCVAVNMILFTASMYAYNEVTIIDLAMDKRGRKEGKTYFRFLLYLVDVALAAVWLWLCIRWMNATKKSPLTPSAFLLIFLSSYITLSPLVVLVATVFKDTVYSILRLALFATVFGYCVKAVQFSTRFTPFPFLGGAVLLFQVVFFSLYKVVTLLVA